MQSEVTPSESSRSILVADDDEVFRSRLVRALRDRGHDASGAASADEALELARADAPEWAIVDLRMPGPIDGLELVVELKRIDQGTEVVVLTGYGSIATALEAVRRGALHYCTKPTSIDDLLATFARTGPAPSGSSTAEGGVPTLARVEWEHIHRVLTDCGGNVSLAARALGLHRRSLQRKLAKYPVRR